MSLLRGLQLQSEVVHALILRETRTRFGAHQLGYLWALMEPGISILTFYVFFRVVGRQPPEGMDLFSFVATGVMPYTLFGSTANKVAEAVNGNKALLYYPQVRPLDLILARGLLEAVTLSAVFMVLMGGHALWKNELVFDSLLLTIGGFAMAALLGMGVGMVFCALGQLSNAVDRARGPILRPLYWVSGIFFTAESLPDSAREHMLWNPILHASELVRDGWFASYDSRHLNERYVLFWILGLFCLGLALERLVRRKIELT